MWQKIDEKDYLKVEIVCKSCYKKNRRKNTLIQKQQLEIEKVKNNNNNRTLILGFSNCDKIYLMNRFLLQKQELVYIITTAPNQYPNNKAQISDEIQP